MWAEARVTGASWELAGTWERMPIMGKEPDLPAEVGAVRITIAHATTVFLNHRQTSEIAPATLRKYKTFLKQLTGFTESLGYVMLDQIRPGDIDQFYTQWELGSRSKGKRLGTLRAFFAFCLNREWIKKTPVSADIKPPLGANRVANKAPFTDHELQLIFAACDNLGDVPWSNGRENGIYSGQDVKDFIYLMLYTGLRISDVGLFDMERLKGNEIFLRAKKNGGDVFAYIPEWLRDRLTSRARRCGQRPFIMGKSDRLETVTDLWRRKIQRVFELAGEFDEPPTPHRFRHTFARILLQRGVPVSDVAELLGDDEKTVRQHYARWVPERQARLTKILKDAFYHQPEL